LLVFGLMDKTGMWKSVRIFLGVCLILLGIIGLFLPILQGILFIVLGVGFLGWPPAVRFVKKVKKRFGR